jgi:hypothetical protein
MSLGSCIRLALLLVIACTLVLTMGCSFSASSESSSEIISSPFASSSASSGAEEEVVYEEETVSYTSSYFRGDSFDQASFHKGLSDIASRRGISDWEANPGTWTSVGRGLARAGLSEPLVTDYVASLAAGNDAVAVLLMQGYAATP